MSKEFEELRRSFWRLVSERRYREAYLVVEELQSLRPLAIIALLKSGLLTQERIRQDLLEDLCNNNYELRDLACLVEQMPDEIWRVPTAHECLGMLSSRRGERADSMLCSSERIQIILIRSALWHGREGEAKDAATLVGESLANTITSTDRSDIKRTAGRVACLACETLVIAGEIRMAEYLSDLLENEREYNLSGEIIAGAAQARFRLCKYRKAMDLFRKALHQGIDSYLMRARARWGIGNCGLLLSEYTSTNFCLYAIERGIRDAERKQRYPRWRGEEKCSVLIKREQGLGEEIFFTRLARLLIVRYPETTFFLEASSELLVIAQEWLPGRIVSEKEEGEQEQSYDYAMTAGSIPFYLDTDRLPRDAASIVLGHRTTTSSDQRKAAAKRNRSIRVGLVWRTSRTIYGPQKSVGLTLLQRLLDVCGIEIISFQHAMLAEEIEICKMAGIEMHDTKSTLSWLPLYERMKDIDIMICCSTAAAHLSSGLGIRTVVLLAEYHSNGWMWNHDNDGIADWYPESLVIRQSNHCNWDKEIEIAVEEVCRVRDLALRDR